MFNINPKTLRCIDLKTLFMLSDTEHFHPKTALNQDETDGKESVLSPGAEAGYRAGAELMWKEIREKRSTDPFSEHSLHLLQPLQ